LIVEKTPESDSVEKDRQPLTDDRKLQPGERSKRQIEEQPMPNSEDEERQAVADGKRVCR
jgi:hypothetical protein